MSKVQQTASSEWQHLSHLLGAFNPRPYPTTGRSGAVVVDRRR